MTHPPHDGDWSLHTSSSRIIGCCVCKIKAKQLPQSTLKQHRPTALKSNCKINVNVQSFAELFRQSTISGICWYFWQTTINYCKNYFLTRFSLAGMACWSAGEHNPTQAQDFFFFTVYLHYKTASSSYCFRSHQWSISTKIKNPLGLQLTEIFIMNQ